jgi:hypothetical protein
MLQGPIQVRKLSGLSLNSIIESGILQRRAKLGAEGRQEMNFPIGEFVELFTDPSARRNPRAFCRRRHDDFL